MNLPWFSSFSLPDPWLLIIFQQVDIYLNEPIKIDELIKLIFLDSTKLKVVSKEENNNF